MAEYIERSAGMSILRAKANMAGLMDAALYFEKAAQMLEKLPACCPVVNGRWLFGEDYMFCSKCGMQWNYCDNDTQDFKYCPNCGAKMDEGDNNATD